MGQDIRTARTGRKGAGRARTCTPRRAQGLASAHALVALEALPTESVAHVRRLLQSCRGQGPRPMTPRDPRYAGMPSSPHAALLRHTDLGSQVLHPAAGFDSALHGSAVARRRRPQSCGACKCHSGRLAHCRLSVLGQPAMQDPNSAMMTSPRSLDRVVCTSRRRPSPATKKQTIKRRRSAACPPPVVSSSEPSSTITPSGQALVCHDHLPFSRLNTHPPPQLPSPCCYSERGFCVFPTLESI